MTAKKIALFIDADNVSARFGKQIIDTLESRGEIFIRRIYGNWEKTSLHGWNECILNFSLRAVHQLDFVAGKNATDMSLVIDAMDVLYGGKAEIFALVSNDSDFTPLVIRLREGGIKIIGMGNTHAANSFRLACDEFIDLDAAEVEISSEPKKKVSAPEKISSVQISLFDEETPETDSPVANPKVVSIIDSQIQTIHDVLHETAKAHADETGFVSLIDARLNLRDKNLGFTVKDFGYGTLYEFMTAFPNLYEVTGNSYRCLGIPNAREIRQVNDILRETAKAYGDDEGFVDLGQAGNALIQKNFNIKDFGCGALKNFIAAFPLLYEVKENSYRCLGVPTAREIRQVHEVLRGAAKTYRDDSGFTELTRAGEGMSKKNLDVKNWEYGTLKNFIAAFPNLYEIKSEGSVIFYRCRTPDKLQKIHDALHEAAETYGDEKGFVDFSRAGDYMGKKNLTIKNSGYSSISKFISAFPELYEVKGMGAATYYRCRMIDKFKPIHDVLREVAATYTDLYDPEDFTSLNRAGMKAHEKNLDIKNFGYSSWSKFVSDFPKIYDVKKFGTNIYYRCL